MSEKQDTPTVGKAAIESFMGGASMGETMQAAKRAEQGEILNTPAPSPEKSDEEKQQQAYGEAQSELKELETHLSAAEKEVDRHNEVLRRLNMSKEDAYQIIDTLLIRGARYRETMVLLNGQLRITFQTRVVADQDLLNEIMETRRPQYYAGVSAEAWRHFLAASIVRFGEKTFYDEKIDDYEKRVAWVNSLQEPIFQMLVEELQRFDEKITALLKPTFLRNF